MLEKHPTVIGLFSSHHDAEKAVKSLQKTGFDMKKISVVSKDFHREEAVPYYNAEEHIATWGKFGLFWGWIWGILFGSAFFTVPGIGAVMAGGPLVRRLISGVETTFIGNGLTALGSALVSLGVTRDSALHYETAIRANKFMLVVHCNLEQYEIAVRILIDNKAEQAMFHTPVKSDQQPRFFGHHA